MNNTKADQAKSLIENPSMDRAKSISTQYLNSDIWGQIVGMSKTLFASGALPQHYNNASKVVMALQAGYEMGMKPIEALNSLYPVNGTFNIWGKATIKRLRVHGYMIQYKDETDVSCTAVVTKNEEKYEETFTFKMAEQSGYTTGKHGLKVGWKLGMNRKRKLRYSALSMIIHTYIPDVLDSANEIQEVYEDAHIDIVEESKKDVSNFVKKQDEKETVEVSDLDNFLKDSKENKKVEEAEVVKKKKTKPVVDNVGKKTDTKDKKAKK